MNDGMRSCKPITRRATTKELIKIFNDFMQEKNIK
jgi:hypothetical protein